MSDHEIETLLNESGPHCLTLTIPVHRLGAERQMDPKITANMIAEAKELLRQENWETENRLENFFEHLDEAVADIDYTHSGEGIGIYASPNRVRIVRFPFPVEKKIVVADSFACRELLYYRNFIREYYILALDKKQISLYHIKNRCIEELHNEDFPLILDNNYEYAKPAPVGIFGGSGVKSFERDKTSILEIRLSDLMKKADEKIGGYLAKHPVLLAGGDKELGEYAKVTRHEKEIFARIRGIYPATEKQTLAERSWEILSERQREEQCKLIDELKEAFGWELLVTGLEQVWGAAFEGKGLELVLEKDYREHGWISADRSRLSLEKIPGEGHTHYTDAVDECIRLVREKNGKVTFVDNGRLEEFDRIALRLRYV